MARPKKETEERKELAKKPVDLGIYKFLTAEDIDVAIKGQLEKSRSYARPIPWPVDLLLIRNSVIIEYIAKQGLSVYECTRQISDRFDIAIPTAKLWIKEALHSLSEFAIENIEDSKKTHIERLESILQESLDRGCSDVALKCLDQLAKINGLYTEKKEIKVEGENITFEFS